MNELSRYTVGTYYVQNTVKQVFYVVTAFIISKSLLQQTIMLFYRSLTYP